MPVRAEFHHDVRFRFGGILAVIRVVVASRHGKSRKRRQKQKKE